jgi:hypothetical protein
VAQEALQFSREAAVSSSADTQKSLKLTRDALTAFQAQAVASRRIASTSEKTADETNRIARATAAQLRQRDQQFALEQRPLSRWGADSDVNKSDYFLRIRERVRYYGAIGFKTSEDLSPTTFVCTKG